MTAPLIIDSDILIDVLRNHPPAIAFLENTDNELLISVMSCVELWAGAKGRKQEQFLRELLAGFDKVEVSEPIAQRACEISYQFSKSHGTGAVDAVIAASAEAEGAILVTLNKKHFSMLSNLHIPYTKP